MTIGSKIHSTLQLSRKLTDEEVLKFESIKYVNVYEFEHIHQTIYPLKVDFEYINNWVYEDGNLSIGYQNDKFFFIETLEYLIRIFFKPLGISIIGFVIGIDEIFGDYFSYYVEDSKVYIDINTVKNLETYVYSNDRLENINIVFNQIIKNV